MHVHTCKTVHIVFWSRLMQKRTPSHHEETVTERAPTTIAAQPHRALLTTAEVCDLAESLTGLRPSPSTVFRWAKKGTRGCRLPFRRLGSRMLFPRLATLHFLGGTEPNSGQESDSHPSAAAVAAMLGTAWAGCSPTSSRAQQN